MQVDEGQIQAAVFILREGEESLSVNWLEFLKCISRESEITNIRTIYSQKMSRVGARARIAILHVGEIRNKVLTESPDSRNLEVLHDPSKDDPSHSGIYNLKQDNELIAELILETVSESYSARK
jgi:hypothetical protein